MNVEGSFDSNQTKEILNDYLNRKVQNIILIKKSQIKEFVNKHVKKSQIDS